MAQYIDKFALVAEIEKRYKYWREKEFNSHSIESEIRMSECQHLMLQINTLKVKEVDINKEISQFINTNFEKATIGHKLSLRRTAKHFFELGLKTQYSSIDNPNIDDLFEEDGIDPNSKEAKIFKECYHTALEIYKEKKGIV